MYEAPNNVNPPEMETVPTETVPTETVPTETVPTETVPTETVPTETVPTETVPTEKEVVRPFMQRLVGFDPDDYERENLSSETVSSGLARFIIKEITGGNSQDATLETMLDGTAPLALRETPDFTDEERRIIFNSPENIILHFVRGPGGREIVRGDTLSAVLKNAQLGAVTGAMQTYAFVEGMRQTNRLMRAARVIPKNKKTLIAQLLATVGGGITAAMAANTPIELTEKVLFGEEDVVLPGTEAPSRVARGVAEDVSGGFSLVKRIRGDTDLGFRNLIETSKKRVITGPGLGASDGYTVVDATGKVVARFPRTVSGKERANAFALNNPETREVFNPNAVSRAFGSRTYYQPERGRLVRETGSIRASRTMEDIINRIGEDARKHPVVFLGTEFGASGAGQMIRESALQNDNTGLNTFLLEMGANMGAGYSMDLLLRKAIPALKGLSKAAFSPFFLRTTKTTRVRCSSFFTSLFRKTRIVY